MNKHIVHVLSLLCLLARFKKRATELHVYDNAKEVLPLQVSVSVPAFSYTFQNHGDNNATDFAGCWF